jgi:Tfp pilus assembly protein PilF
MAPKHPADVDGWTTLASVAQLNDQQEAAFTYYSNALTAAKTLRGDQLFQRIYGSTMSQMWFGEGEAIDTSFNKIVEAFAAHQRLVDLYDFLRDTDQVVKARRVAEQYELYDVLKEAHGTRVAQARAEFQQHHDNPFEQSVAYFAEVCKLADLYDQTGDWPTAQKAYEQYLEDFPDELGLLITLSEVAERDANYEAAIAWEKKVVATKERLLRQARAWSMRELALQPSVPQILKGAETDQWSWGQRWGRQQWWYGGNQHPLDVSPSWIRIAQLYLAQENSIAAGDALGRAIALAGSDRESVGQRVLALIRQRQLVPKMLPVLRSLAVQMPTDEQIQLAFAEALESNDRGAVATEVYQRMLRRGVSDVGTLAKVRQKLGALAPEGESVAAATLESLEAEAAADAGNAKKRLRLAKAYYYSLRIDDALKALQEVIAIAPHLEGVHDLLIEIYTLQGDSAHLVEALRTKIQRVSDPSQRNRARRRLVDELLTMGDDEAALKELKELADPKDPGSYENVALLLHYFGRHDEAVAQFELAARSQSRGMWEDDSSGQMIARSMVIKGDYAGAADRILVSVDQKLREQVQYAGMMSVYAMFGQDNQFFAPFSALLAVVPELSERLQAKLEDRHKEKADDPQAAKVLMEFYQTLGRTDLADALLDQFAEKGSTDQALVMRMIDQAAKRRDFERAIALARDAIAQQPKPQLPPGIPPQFAGMFNVMSSRNLLLCKLGDLHWQMGKHDEAFAAYRQIVDDKVDETRIAFAAICLVRDRVDDARTIIEEALKGQQVKSPNLLQFRALMAVIDNKPVEAFEALTAAAEAGAGEANNPFSFNDGGNPLALASQFASRTDQIDRFVQYVTSKRIAKNPSSWQDYQTLVGLLTDAGRRADAIALLDKAAENKAIRLQAVQEKIRLLESYAPDETLIPLYQEWIDLAEKKVKPSALGQLFGRAQQEAPGDTQNQRDRLGDLLWRSGKTEEAEKAWQGRLNLTAAASHLALAKRFMDQEAADRARKAYEKAIELEPDHTAAHEALVSLVWTQADGRAAMEHLTEVFLKKYRPAPVGVSESEAPDFYSQASYDPYDDDDYDNRARAAQASSAELRRWAFELSRSAPGGSDDQRLALNTLTGDWSQVEAEIKRRLDSAPYEPMVWELWAIARERQGDWKEAARARDRVRRVRQTTIADRREQLKLVLAGEQIRDAAAGTKEADPNVPGASGATRSYSYSRYYSSYYDSGNSADADTERLAALNIRLGDYARAERLYLIGKQRGVEYILASISNLMWDQGAKDRALELSKLSATLAQQGNQLIAYARMLAEAGRVDEAAQLLVRVYRGQSPRESDTSMYGFYGGYDYDNDNEQQGFESQQEQQTSLALHQLLERAGKLDATLAALRKQAGENPDDKRLTKLILSLERRARRWDDARKGLAEWRKSRPVDDRVLFDEFLVLLQVRDWPAALENLNRLRELAPERAGKWALAEAFVRLAQGDRAGAVAVIEPLLEAEVPPADVRTAQLCTVLAAAGEHRKLGAFLERADSRNRLEDGEALLLVQALQLSDAEDRALRTALDRLWEQVDPITERSPWVQVVSTIVLRPDGQTPTYRELSPEDEALIGTLRAGADSSVAAWQRLLTEKPDSVNARRGLVFAMVRNGDDAAAATAAGEFLDWVAARRGDTWYTPRRPALAQSARAFLERSKTTGLNTSAVLSMSMSVSNLLNEPLNAGGGSEAVRYGALWDGYQQYRDGLLANAARTDLLREALQAQNALAKARQLSDSNRSDSYSYRSYGLGGVQYYTESYAQPRQALGSWKSEFRALARSKRLFEVLRDEYVNSPGDIPPREWSFVAEAYAALGDEDKARETLRKAADYAIADLRAGDSPKLRNRRTPTAYNYYTNFDAREEQLRQALRVSRPEIDEKEDPDRPLLRGTPAALSEFALVDPQVAEKLVALGETVGPGWGDCATVGVLMKYLIAARRPKDVIAMLERVFEPAELIESQQLGAYLRACFETRDVPRVEKALSAIHEINAALDDEAALLRLVLLRQAGDSSAAEALEKQLIAGCRTTIPNPCEPDARYGGPAAGAMDQVNYRRYSSGSSWNRYRRSWQSAPNMRLASLRQLAQALGIPLVDIDESRDMTVADIRDAYSRVQLYSDAARLTDMTLAQIPEGRLDERAQEFWQKAHLLKKAGAKAAALDAAKQVEELYLRQIPAAPYDCQPWMRLAALYASELGGNNQVKALEMLQHARQIDLSADPGTLQEARCLYELGKFDEASKRYEFGLTHSEGPIEAGILFRAGLASARAGKRDAALPLLRQALWCDPFNSLAADAREILHD